jgi:hypothetical protein
MPAGNVTRREFRILRPCALTWIMSRDRRWVRRCRADAGPTDAEARVILDGVKALDPHSDVRYLRAP